MNTSNIYRDVTLDHISEQDVGKTLRVAGWVENIRDHGGVSFVDLRDMYGVLQVVMRDTSLLDGINKEDCISIEGIMEHRDEDTYNPKIPTGTIELEAHKVDMLGNRSSVSILQNNSILNSILDVEEKFCVFAKIAVINKDCAAFHNIHVLFTNQINSRFKKRMAWTNQRCLR